MESLEENKIVKEILKSIEDVNQHFLMFVESNDDKEKERLHFFREKYLQFLIYSSLKKKEFMILPEESTELKFSITGKKERSGNHDLILVHNDQKFAGFEFYLGYDVDYKNLNSNDFSKHLKKDYEKLIKSSLAEIFILNYFFKSHSKRSSHGKVIRKEKSYQEHFKLCHKFCEELVKNHKESNPDKNLYLWMIEGRDDGHKGHGILCFN